MLNTNIDIDIKIVNKNLSATDIPKYQTDGAIGLDLIAAIDMPKAIHSGRQTLIPTGIAINIKDANLGAFVFARSGLAIKSGICLTNGVGVIDSDYQGEIMVPLFNRKKSMFLLMPKTRIAQLVFMPVKKISFNLVGNFDTTTSRGENGFGSTGI